MSTAEAYTRRYHMSSNANRMTASGSRYANTASAVRERQCRAWMYGMHKKRVRAIITAFLFTTVVLLMLVIWAPVKANARPEKNMTKQYTSYEV